MTEKPKWVDLFGIDPDYTEGRDIGEWLAEQRGESPADVPGSPSAAQEDR